MDLTLFPIISFFVGCVVGSVGLISSKWHKRDLVNLALIFLLSVAMALVAFGWADYMGMSRREFLQIGFLAGSVTYLLVFAKVFRDRVLLGINELTVVGINTLLGCFLFMIQPGIFVWLVFLLPTYVTVLIALFPVYLSARIRVGLYCWYLVMLLVLSLYLTGQQVVLPFIDSVGTHSVFGNFISGTIFAYLIIHFSYLFRLLPYKREAETQLEFNERLAEHFSALSFKFSPDQYHFLSGLFVVSLVCFVFFTSILTGVFSVASAVTFIFLVISVAQTLFNKFFRTKSEYENGLKEVMKSEHKKVFSAKVVVFLPIALVIAGLIVFILLWPEKASEEVKLLMDWFFYG